ncbi:Hypothetical predicted protein [Xyrichtys novacula]|uniref:Uncharacterized protein n=1 Tax=Xyrichtys novacula TaxID=13765 RepID=A0AAV1EMI1_XYRNO|nr:Hypothetical predicted protein [Xyrichtys novacula]
MATRPLRAPGGLISTDQLRAPGGEEACCSSPVLSALMDGRTFSSSASEMDELCLQIRNEELLRRFLPLINVHVTTGAAHLVLSRHRAPAEDTGEADLNQTVNRGASCPIH